MVSVLMLGFVSCSDDDEGSNFDFSQAEVSDVQAAFIGTWDVNYDLRRNGESDGWTSVWTILEDGTFTTEDSDDDGYVSNRKYRIAESEGVFYFVDSYQKVEFEIKGLTSKSFSLYAKDGSRERIVTGKRK